MAQEKQKYDVKSGIIQGPILGKLAEVFSGSFSTTKVVKRNNKNLFFLTFSTQKKQCKLENTTINHH